MTCYHPRFAWKSQVQKHPFQVPTPRITFTPSLHSNEENTPLQLPCGQCIGCRTAKAKQWTLRCAHESKQHEKNSFITLTYDQEPENGSLQPNDYTLFMKKLRNLLGNTKIKYYMCGEYGHVYDEDGKKIPGELGRPHYHACLFGYDFPDREFWKNSKTGHPIYRSQELERAWPLGFSTVQNYTTETARYTASYILKKITGQKSDEHYRKLSTDTGELVYITPEYHRVSNGIGKKFILNNFNDVYPKDFITEDGFKYKPPRYYDELLKQYRPDEYEEVKKNGYSISTWKSLLGSTL